jgi:hypothetical protein
MHDPSQVHPENPTPQPADALASVETLSVSPEPGEVSPVGYAMLSGLFGVTLGVIVAPWLEKQNGKIRKDREKPADTEANEKDQGVQ